MNQTFKHFWAHRRQNGFVLVEIALVAFLSFFFLDNFVVTTYDTYLCSPAGEFEHEHLLIGQVGVKASASPAEGAGEEINGSPLANLFALRDKVRALPEVQYAGLTDGVSGHYSPSTYCAEADTTRRCGAYEEHFVLHEQFFETLGLTTLDGSPSAEKLSEDCPIDGAVITRSMALALFGTPQAVGRRIVECDYSDPAMEEGRTVKSRYTVAGVVEDFRLRPNERYCYAILTPRTSLMSTYAKMLIRLRPEADAEAFAINLNQTDMQLALCAGNYGLALANTYEDYTKQTLSQQVSIDLSVMGTFIALLLLNVVLGTLGTFWLQIRKRTEDIGIMRSFGAKRRNIFGMLWREAALLTLIAAIIGQIVWLQFAINVGLAHGFTMSGSGQETDWVNNFGLHYLIVCAIQYLILLAIVTLGMVVPTFIAMYKRPVDALRHE